MKIKHISLLIFLLGIAVSSGAQVRPSDSNSPSTVTSADRKMLEDIKAEYRGGLFGFSKKEKGTIKFDDLNMRLQFYGENGKELFSIPYDSIQVVYPSQTKVQSGTGRAIGAIPFPGAGLGGSLLKKKKNYLVISFSDIEVNAQGTMNFLVDTQDLLFNSIYTIGEKAEMKARGDAYIRSRTY